MKTPSAPAAPRLVAALALLLAVSLAGNAALLLRAAKNRAAAAAATNPAPSGSGASTATPAPDTAASSGVSPEAAAALSRALAATSLTDFRDLLVAAGIEPKLRKEMLQLLLQNRYADRFHTLYTDKAELAKTPWWRNPDYRELNSSVIQRQRQEEGLALQKQFEAELTALTGENSRDLDFEENPWLERQYGGLPREKAEALYRLQRDYDELEQEIRSESMNFQLPADREKLRLLRSERERDIAALLTPEERTDWELKSSPTADRVRDLATRYQANETEYRRIFALQKAFDERFNVDEADDLGRDIDWEQQNAAQNELQKAIREIVGAERHLAAQRENDMDYNLARSAVERLGLPAETAAAIHGLRSPAAERSQAIAADPSLAPDQKTAALAKLAADTRAEIERTLGREAAELYFKRGGMSWLQYLATGRSIRIDPETGYVAPRNDDTDAVPTIRIE